MPQGEGAVSGVVSGIVRHFRPILYNGDIRIQTYWSIIDSCVKNWQYFRTHGIQLNSVSNSLYYDVVRFKIEVGVEEKFMYKNVTQHRQHGDRHSSSKAAPRRHLSDLDLTINMLGLCYPSNLLFEYSVSTLAAACQATVDLEHDYHQNQWYLCDVPFSNYFEDLFILVLPMPKGPNSAVSSHLRCELGICIMAYIRMRWVNAH